MSETKALVVQKPVVNLTRPKWNHCKCGCRGVVLRFGKLCFWVLDDPDKGYRQHLYLGHGIDMPKIGTYSGFLTTSEVVKGILRRAFYKVYGELKRKKLNLADPCPFCRKPTEPVADNFSSALGWYHEKCYMTCGGQTRFRSF
jgi:hypothetical protein